MDKIETNKIKDEIEENDKDILFSGSSSEQGELSNFYPCKITIEGRKQPTTEHQFQSQKFIDQPDQCQKIQSASNPIAAKKLGRSHKQKLREDWEAIKDAVMKTALSAKFSQNSELQNLLLSTGDRKLVEHSYEDFYWANGGDGSGKNMLGLLLMEVRTELRTQYIQKQTDYLDNDKEEVKKDKIKPPILFQGPKNAQRDFSNFQPSAITIGGLEWPTTEHYFQAQKFIDCPDFQEKIRKANSPAKAKSLGRSRDQPIRKDWEEIKDDVMLEALRAKFYQHTDLRDVLVGTGNRELAEHTKSDKQWADGGDGKGKNMLGILLMKVRDELKNI